MTSTPSVYTIKISLAHVSPFVWRRVEIPADITLYRLAAVIICAMGWHGGHLHQFLMGEKYYGIPDDEFPSDFETHDERETLLKDLVEAGTRRLVFAYDFGDGWEHAVELEKTSSPQKGAKYPRCTAGARACPPEDCGGPPGYEDLLEAVRDPNHAEHEEMREWIGGDFDPEAFDPEGLDDLAGAARDMEEQWDEHF